MNQTQYNRLVREMAEPPALDDQVVEYAAEVGTGGTAGVPDTILLVTQDAVHARPKKGMENESELSFSLGMDEIRELECEGMFSQSLALRTHDHNHTIAAEGLDALDFTCAIVENSHLTNSCERFGMGRIRFTVCKWTTCLGCALVLLGVGLSITMIGLLVGVPLIAAGVAVLVFAFGYKKLGEMMQDNVWTSPEPDANAV